MRYVIIRDDDTNALTPVSCLERMYRPFLERGMPVTLATIPGVALDTTLPNGKPEGFLAYGNGTKNRTMPIAANTKLVGYLRDNDGFKIAQHGLHHDYLEFDGIDRASVSDWLDEGTRLLLEAGFSPPETFVAPYDKFSRAALRETAHRFRVVSSGWYELGRIPLPWWPRYAWKKFRAAPHWRIGRTLLLSHPGCLLSCFRLHEKLLESIRAQIEQQRLTVLVTHWWEYFRNNGPDLAFVQVLHQTADYLAQQRDVKVISFVALLKGDIPLL